eukprot:GHVH01012277.1.p1 GENE.GHVH01012277.1~~GHVH01012277.1.p1  ORF type:complete len:231 (+),score=19.23 GHVH01012277.1:226-918(+)
MCLKMLEECDGDVCDCVAALNAIHCQNSNHQNVPSTVAPPRRRRSSLGLPVRRMSRLDEARVEGLALLDRHRNSTISVVCDDPDFVPDLPFALENDLADMREIDAFNCSVKQHRRASVTSSTGVISPREFESLFSGEDYTMKTSNVTKPPIVTSETDELLVSMSTDKPKRRRSSLGLPVRRLSQMGLQKPDESLYPECMTPDAGKPTRARRSSLGKPVRRSSQMGMNPLS